MDTTDFADKAIELTFWHGRPELTAFRVKIYSVLRKLNYCKEKGFYPRNFEITYRVWEDIYLYFKEQTAHEIFDIKKEDKWFIVILKRPNDIPKPTNTCE